MIETLEVLLKEYELNSIENNNSYTVRNRNAKAQVKRSAPSTAMEEEEGGAEGAQSKEKVESQGGEEEEKVEGGEVAESSPSLFVASKSVTECLSNMVLAKGEHIGRGHTAYLTFATKMK